MATHSRLAARSIVNSVVSSCNDYICLRCQTRTLFAATSNNLPRTPKYRATSRSYATNNGYEDKYRKKIWGQNDPQEQNDPYINETPEERADRLQEEEQRAITQKEIEDIRSLSGPDDSGPPENDVSENLAEFNNEQLDEQSAESMTVDYAPATTWRNLRHVPNYNAAEQIIKPWFTGFPSSTKLTSRSEVEDAVQQALVEIWTLKQAGKSFVTPKDSPSLSKPLQAQLLSTARFIDIGSGDFRLEFGDESIESEMMTLMGLEDDNDPFVLSEQANMGQPLSSVNAKDLKGDKPVRASLADPILLSEEEELPSDEHVEDAQMSSNDAISDEVQFEQDLNTASLPRDNSWRRVPIGDAEVKFAFIRRVMHLTGTRIPDAAIAQIRYAKDFIPLLVSPEKPQKLASILSQQKDLFALPNVHLSTRRWTGMDREQEIGRKKMIREALAARGLPTDLRRAEQVKRR